MKQLGAIALALALSLSFSKPAHALTFGDAALTVSITTVSGAILGVSTLPFYDDSGKHTKNIFYGAALGAVAGVLIAAYAGVQEGAVDDEEVVLRKQERETLYLAQRRLVPEKTIASSSYAEKARGSVLVWSPLASVQF